MGDGKIFVLHGHSHEEVIDIAPGDTSTKTPATGKSAPRTASQKREPKR
jgi:hypothetical protein